MKRLFPLLLLLMAALTVNSQDEKSFHAGIGGGYMGKLAGEVQVGYSTGMATAIAGLITPVSPRTGDVQAAYFKLGFGFPLGRYGTIEVGGGYANHFGPRLKAELASTGILFNACYLHVIGANELAFVSVNKTRAITSASVGVRWKFLYL